MQSLTMIATRIASVFRGWMVKLGQSQCRRTPFRSSLTMVMAIYGPVRQSRLPPRNIISPIASHRLESAVAYPDVAPYRSGTGDDNGHKALLLPPGPRCLCLLYVVPGQRHNTRARPQTHTPTHTHARRRRTGGVRAARTTNTDSDHNTAASWPPARSGDF